MSFQIDPIQHVPEEILSQEVFSRCVDDVPALACVSKKFSACCDNFPFTRDELNQFSERVQVLFPVPLPCKAGKASSAIYRLLSKELDHLGLSNEQLKKGQLLAMDVFIDDLNMCRLHGIREQKGVRGIAKECRQKLQEGATNNQLQHITKLKPELRLTRLPEDISLYKNLQSLWLEGHNLVCLPASVGKLSQLSFLHVGGNPIQSFPPSLGNIPHLQVIHYPPEKAECVIL